MARCPDCNKFVSYDTETEPEVENVSIDIPEVEKGEGANATVSAEVRIVNNCADCGSEMAEAMFELEGDVEIPAEHIGEGHEIEVGEDSVQRDERFTEAKNPRYAKHFYSVEFNAHVACSCGKFVEIVTMTDEVQASGMDSLV